MRKERDKNWKIYAYMFDCHEFCLNNMQITGLCCAIKIQEIKPIHNLHELVEIELTKNEGFTVLIRSIAKNIIVQPYKIYGLALCNNSEEKLVEISNKVLKEHNDSIIESISNHAESSWLINEC